MRKKWIFTMEDEWTDVTQHVEEQTVEFIILIQLLNNCFGGQSSSSSRKNQTFLRHNH